jgi:UDP-N-acetylglucosamine 4,6-dehydratase
MIYLVTGGTGSLGKALTRLILAEEPDATIRIFSRDELKQGEMAAAFASPRLRFLLGDVRDRDRIRRACESVDVVVHAAAMKQVPACEYNPLEAIKTNVLGAENVIEAALDARVRRVLALSTDKAVNPANLYGATKLCSDKLFVQANVYAGPRPTRFAVVRYGNVIGSRGSVVPLFRRQAPAGTLTITDERMTRFWITLPQAAAFVHSCGKRMVGGEIFVPRLPTMRVVDLARTIAPDARHEVIGIRPGEKLHEVLVTDVEARDTYAFDDHYVIRPPPSSGWAPLPEGGDPVPDGFTFSSDDPGWVLGPEDLREMLEAADTEG